MECTESVSKSILRHVFENVNDNERILCFLMLGLDSINCFDSILSVGSNVIFLCFNLCITLNVKDQFYEKDLPVDIIQLLARLHRN